jgi:hypothetical protein
MNRSAWRAATTSAIEATRTLKKKRNAPSERRARCARM